MMVYDIGVNSSYRGFTKAVFAGLEVAEGGRRGFRSELRRCSRGGKAWG